MSKGWAITLLVLVVVLFVGGSTVAALSFVASLNARPLTVSCTVDSTYGDVAQPSDEGERPGFSVQTTGGGNCEDFYVRDVAVREQLAVGQSYEFTIENLIGYTNVVSVEPVE
ncbi:hypothetical protein GCM10027413_09330 [Conyzicola nivalis]|uniref:Uncharacterized protein n=1 Tax=Conyzicola nivalis TaxID=1477021 RepID=A0A916SJD1_9MICO|nr:hypothetical protein [Conyzicola nivalis]GGB03187.1 hypothetical protein GCM10010979_17300 [Conyzicola nivalis]